MIKCPNCLEISKDGDLCGCKIAKFLREDTSTISKQRVREAKTKLHMDIFFACNREDMIKAFNVFEKELELNEEVEK